MNNENRPSPENDNLTPPHGTDMNAVPVPEDQTANPTPVQEPVNTAPTDNPAPNMPNQSFGNSQQQARPQSAPSQENIPPYGQSFSQSQQSQQPQPPMQPPQQPNYGYGAYTPPQYVPYTPVQTKPETETEPPMRVRDWLLVMLIMTIPCVNIIMMFVWAFSDTPGKKSRANYFKAQLLWVLICIGAVALFYLLLFVILLALGQSIDVGDIFESMSPSALYQAIRNLI